MFTLSVRPRDACSLGPSSKHSPVGLGLAVRSDPIVSSALNLVARGRVPCCLSCAALFLGVQGVCFCSALQLSCWPTWMWCNFTSFKKRNAPQTRPVVPVYLCEWVVCVLCPLVYANAPCTCAQRRIRGMVWFGFYFILFFVCCWIPFSVCKRFSAPMGKWFHNPSWTVQRDACASVGPVPSGRNQPVDGRSFAVDLLLNCFWLLSANKDWLCVCVCSSVGEGRSEVKMLKHKQTPKIWFLVVDF